MDMHDLYVQFYKSPFEFSGNLVDAYWMDV